MSFLNGVEQPDIEVRPLAGPEIGTEKQPRPGIIGRCSNPECRSGWFHLFRKRTRPIFESGWTCSPECTEARLRDAVQRELSGWVAVERPHHHRIPLGLLMLENSWIEFQQLRRALNAQRKEGRGRVGEWLIAHGATDEARVARAVSMQWGCPVLLPRESSAAHRGRAPRLFLEKFGALELDIAANSMMYLGFEQAVDWALAFSITRMTGLRVETGIVPSSAFARASQRALMGEFPPVQIAEAVSAWAAAHVFAKSIELHQPSGAKLVRVHEWLWLRMFLDSQNAGNLSAHSQRDILCRVGPF